MKDITILTYHTQSPINHFIADLMRRRTNPGQPEEVTVIVDEALHTAYGWTDGICSWLSIFLPGDTSTVNTIKEICVLQSRI